MDISKGLIVPYNKKIIDFFGERVDTCGYLNLQTRIRSRKDGREVRVCYRLVEANMSYNIVIG